MGREGLDTRDKSLTMLRAEEAPYFGEMALLREDSRRTATVKAVETVDTFNESANSAQTWSSVVTKFKLEGITTIEEVVRQVHPHNGAGRDIELS